MSILNRDASKAELRAAVAELEAKIESVRVMHREASKVREPCGCCVHCQSTWPCPTILAVGGPPQPAAMTDDWRRAIGAVPRRDDQPRAEEIIRVIREMRSTLAAVPPETPKGAGVPAEPRWPGPDEVAEAIHERIDPIEHPRAAPPETPKETR